MKGSAKGLPRPYDLYGKETGPLKLPRLPMR